MTKEQLNQYLANLPAEEKSRLIEIGRQYSSFDTLNQADKTLNGLEIEGYAALLADNGFGAQDAEKLTAFRDALDAAGGRRSSAQADKKTTNKNYHDAVFAGKTVRKKAISILGTAHSDLLKVSGEDAKNAAAMISSVLKGTKSIGADARSLANQLEQFQKLLEANKLVSDAASGRGGAKLLDALTKQVAALRLVSPTKQVTSGTLQETELMDLLDGLIIEFTRSARKASRSAAEDTGQEAIASTFTLDSLYRSANQSKANARSREKANLIIKKLTARNVAISKEIEDKLLASKDDVALDKWLALADTVTSAELLFA